MAMRLGIVMSFLVLGLMLGLERSEGVTYSVGDATGWGVPPNADFYDTWTEGKIFRVGDQLSFNWTLTHDVVSVTEAQHDNCSQVTANVIRTSPAVISLTAPGKFYYICTIGDHCSRGQKLDIEVVAASTTPTTPTTPSTGPSASTTPPSTTTPSGSSAPPPPSSSGSFGPMVALSAILSIVAFSFMG